MQERFITAGSVQLHVFESGTAKDVRPLVCIAGGLGTADVFEQTAEHLTPRRCYGITKRGNGQSDKPASGYDLDTQADDLLAAIDALLQEPVVLLAYSAAVPSAVLATHRNSKAVAGLILCDYPAIYPAISDSYVDSVTALPDYDPQDCPPHVLEAIVRESARRELTELLPSISCPTLILHGNGDGSYLKSDALEAYQTNLADVYVAGFEDAGHAFIMTHFSDFIREVEGFLCRIDEQIAGVDHDSAITRLRIAGQPSDIKTPGRRLVPKD